MFFGASGSIAGGQMYAGGSPGARGTYSARWKTVASYRAIDGSRNVEHVRVRRREVDVPAPDPVRLRLREVVDHAERLRVVDDDEVVVVVELARVQLLVAPEDLLVRLGAARARRPAARCGSSS